MEPRPVKRPPLATALMPAVLALSLAAPLGCMPSPAAEAAASRATMPAAEVAVPPKQLVQDLRRVLSADPINLGVESEEGGTLVTSWKRYRGDLHIASYWQERTRYRLEVIPDWDEPTQRSRLRVTAETEQRAAEGQRWDREPRVSRPARARALLDQILARLQPPQGR